MLWRFICIRLKNGLNERKIVQNHRTAGEAIAFSSGLSQRKDCLVDHSFVNSETFRVWGCGYDLV